jgi:hypothetical protein
MWPFKTKKKTEEEIIADVMDELNCQKLYQKYIDCLQNSYFNYVRCPKILEKYRICAIAVRDNEGNIQKQSGNIINPVVFEKL